MEGDGGCGRGHGGDVLIGGGDGGGLVVFVGWSEDENYDGK